MMSRMMIDMSGISYFAPLGLLLIRSLLSGGFTPCYLLRPFGAWAILWIIMEAKGMY